MYLLKCLYQATKVRRHVFVKVPVPSHERYKHFNKKWRIIIINIVLPISVVTTFLFDFYCSCYLFMCNHVFSFPPEWGSNSQR
jgi:Mg2+/citrate symporter